VEFRECTEIRRLFCELNEAIGYVEKAKSNGNRFTSVEEFKKTTAALSNSIVDVDDYVEWIRPIYDKDQSWRERVSVALSDLEQPSLAYLESLRLEANSLPVNYSKTKLFSYLRRKIRDLQVQPQSLEPGQSGVSRSQSGSSRHRSGSVSDGLSVGIPLPPFDCNEDETRSDHYEAFSDGQLQRKVKPKISHSTPADKHRANFVDTVQNRVSTKNFVPPSWTIMQPDSAVAPLTLSDAPSPYFTQGALDHEGERSPVSSKSNSSNPGGVAKASADPLEQKRLGHFPDQIVTTPWGITPQWQRML